MLKTGTPKLQVLQLMSMDQADEAVALIDFGATHALKPARDEPFWLKPFWLKNIRQRVEERAITGKWTLNPIQNDLAMVSQTPGMFNSPNSCIGLRVHPWKGFRKISAHKVCMDIWADM